MSRAKIFNNLIGGTNKGKHSAVMGSELSVNMFRETSGDSVYQASLPGLKLVEQVAEQGTACRGSWVSSVGLSAEGGRPELFYVFGGTVYRQTETGFRTAIGNVATGGRIVFAETGGLRNCLLICDGANLWRYDLEAGGRLYQITLPASVVGAGNTIRPTHVAVVAGSICVNDADTGFVYYSVPYPLNSDTREVFKVRDGEVQYKSKLEVDTEELDADTICFLDDYQTQQYFNAESSSDRIVAITAVGELLYLFGSSSVEVWQRGSSENQTWIRTSYTANASNGCDASYSIAVIDSTVFYIAAGAAYSKCVMSISGTAFKRISDEWLDQKLIGEDTSTSYGFAYARGQHRFYVLQLGNQKETWCFDGASGLWHQRTSRDMLTGLETRWRASAIQYYTNRFYVMGDGAVFTHDDYWLEDHAEKSVPMVRHRTTPVWIDNNGAFIIEQVAIECNVGAGKDYSVEPKLMLEISRDGGMTYGNIHTASLGKPGQYSHRVLFRCLGRNRLAVMRLTYSSDTDLVLSGCDIVATSTGGIL